MRQRKDADVAEKALKALQALQAFVKNRVSSMAPEQDTSLQQALALLRYKFEVIKLLGGSA